MKKMFFFIALVGMMTSASAQIDEYPVDQDAN